jgi:hypothetical protein
MKPIFRLLVIACTLALLFSVNSNAQLSKIGDKDLDIGVGFATLWITEGYYTIVPPLTVSLDYALRDDWGPGIFTVGGSIGVSRYANERSWNNSGTTEYYGYKYTSTIFGARTTYHYPLFKGFDTYIGAMAGFRINTNNDYGTWPDNPDEFDTDAGFIPVGRIFLGAKYYFNEKLAGYGELGYGISYVTLGVSVKL